MLLVNRFNPTIKRQNNKNTISSPFNPVNFQRKSDSVSFTSVATSRAVNIIEQDAAELAEDVLSSKIGNNYSNLLGKNFNKEFLEPLKIFLKKQGLSIEHSNVEEFEIRERGYHRPHMVVGSNGSSARFKNMGFSEFDVTKNASTVKLLNRAVESGKIILPEKLNQTVNKLSNASAMLKSNWFNTTFSDAEKVERLQKAYKILMPE